METRNGSARRLFGEGDEPFRGALATERFGRSLDFLETVGSTNQVAGERAAAGAAEGTTIVAETQLTGRGRRGRPWLSPPGVNVYFSIVVRPHIAAARLGELSLVAAAALHRALAPFVPAGRLFIKWPNDILAAGGGKLAGVLCEAGIEADVVRHAVVGIGINVNGRAFPPALAGIATSLAIESGAEHSRALVLAAALNRFEIDYRRWQEDSDLAGFLPYLRQHSALEGRTVAVEGRAGGHIGRFEGISPAGELLVRDAGGRIVKVSSGHVRVVPIGPVRPSGPAPGPGAPGGGAGE